MSQAIIILKGELNAIWLPEGELESLDKALEYLDNKSPDQLEQLEQKVGVTLEGISGLIPFTYNDITVFARWNPAEPSVDVYAVGTGVAVYMLVTFKSEVPSPYRLEATDRTLHRVSTPDI